MPYVSYESSRRQEALKKETRKLTQERKENLVDGVNSTITALGDKELNSNGQRMEDNLDEIDTSVTAGNPLSMEKIQKIRFIVTDSEGKNKEAIDSNDGTTNEMASGSYEALGNNHGSLAVPQVSIAKVQNDSQAMEDATDSESDEEKSNIWKRGPDITGVSEQLRAYLYHNPPLHPRRDSDQVVSRYAKNDSDIGKDDHNILMVDQLWIWYIQGKSGSQEPDTVITSFPNRQGAKISVDLDDLRRQVLAKKNHKSRGVISSATDLITRVIEVCSGTLDRHQHVKTLQFVQMFEATIGDAEDKESKMLQQFRHTVEELHNLDEHHPKYHSFRRQKLAELLDIQNESGLLKDIKDIRDEIKMIRAVLADQLKVLKNLNCPERSVDSFANLPFRTPSQAATVLFEKHGLDGNPAQSSVALLGRVYSSLEETNEEFEIMESHAKEVEAGRQANLWEARSSREGAEETARQGNVSKDSGFIGLADNV
ncbi:hypothetical protein NHQ30_006791 [Ciborinia camelliae]|nr:hypothetical protein NHQ30_006791 [Ciborinia camelliae]